MPDEEVPEKVRTRGKTSSSSFHSLSTLPSDPIPPLVPSSISSIVHKPKVLKPSKLQVSHSDPYSASITDITGFNLDQAVDVYYNFHKLKSSHRNHSSVLVQLADAPHVTIRLPKSTSIGQVKREFWAKIKDLLSEHTSFEALQFRKYSIIYRHVGAHVIDPSLDNAVSLEELNSWDKVTWFAHYRTAMEASFCKDTEEEIEEFLYLHVKRVNQSTREYEPAVVVPAKDYFSTDALINRIAQVFKADAKHLKCYYVETNYLESVLKQIDATDFRTLKSLG